MHKFIITYFYKLINIFANSNKNKHIISNINDIKNIDNNISKINRIPNEFYRASFILNNKKLLKFIDSYENSFDFKNSDLLHNLVRIGRYELVKHFLENGYDIDKLDYSNTKPSAYIFLYFNCIHKHSSIDNNYNIIDDFTSLIKFINLFKRYGEDFSYFNDEKFYRYIINIISYKYYNKKLKNYIKNYYIINLLLIP